MRRASRAAFGAPAHAVLVCAAAAWLSGCESTAIRPNAVLNTIKDTVADAAREQTPSTPPAAVREALLPPLSIEIPPATKAAEPRFDVAVNNAPANQVFLAMVSGTRYSMLVHPEIREPISITLRDVTLFEALDALREVYGYEYKLEGTRIYVMPVTMQSRLFQVNYLAGRRAGRTELRVSSGSIQAPVASPTPGAGAAPTPGGGGAPTQPTASVSLESSRVTTSSEHDFWADVQAAVRTIIGEGGGRSVVVNANSGIVMVRALPKELRAVEQYLKTMSLIVERQVMLEAKIIEVTLSDQHATGINWAAFGRHPRFGVGVVTPGTTLRTDGSLSSPNLTVGLGAGRSFTTGAGVAASIFGLAFQTGDFAALLTFLETQGTVHVLSSPRIAAINNQKAVIKVGTDDFFVTSLQTTTVAPTVAGASPLVSPTITTQPFFSGIALDVTPQIADDDLITLHVHPAVSSVSEKTKVLSLGEAGTVTLPLASSTVNESDTIVRVRDGTIAAIGGLMRQQQSNGRSGLPGTGQSRVLSNVFGSRDQQLTKSELVILLKVTVIKGDRAWQSHARELSDRIHDMARPVRAREP